MHGHAEMYKSSSPCAIHNRRDHAAVINGRDCGEYKEIEYNNYAACLNKTIDSLEKYFNSRILHYTGSPNYLRSDHPSGDNAVTARCTLYI